MSGTCPITVTRTYVITDKCGNSSTKNHIINIVDTTKPTGTAPIGTFGINLCVADAISTVQFNPAAIAPSYSDNCGGPVTVVPTDTLLIGDNCGWVLIYTYSVIDVCGNALTGKTITHTGSDQTAPSGSPPPTSLGNSGCKSEANAMYPFDSELAGADYSDNCGEDIVINLTNTSVVGTDCAWAVIYTFSVLDECNNALTGQQMVISGSDMSPPSFTSPPDTVIYANEACEYDASVGVTGDVTDESDNCTSTLNATFVDDVVTGSCDCSYTITRTWSLVDACGNAAPDQVQTIEVRSNIVTNTNDSGAGSLRDVIACAPSGSVITLAPALSGLDIILTSGEIVIDKDLTLIGLGLSNSYVSGSFSSRVFHIQAGSTFSISDMSFKNTVEPTNGGAIFVEGDLILENSRLQNNFENGVERAITISGSGSLEIRGTVDMNN